MILCDIDHFKQINDRYGHPAGDAALCEVARIMARQLQPAEHLARWGGEEFLLILPGVDAEQVVERAEQLRRQFVDHVVAWEGQSFSLTMSLGCATEAMAIVATACCKWRTRRSTRPRATVATGWYLAGPSRKTPIKTEAWASVFVAATGAGPMRHYFLMRITGVSPTVTAPVIFTSSLISSMLEMTTGVRVDLALASRTARSNSMMVSPRLTC